MAIIATELIETKRDERGRRITRVPEREAVVQAYEKSRLTQKAFAKQEGGEVHDVRGVGAGVPTAAVSGVTS